MYNIPMEELLGKTGGIFKLVIMASRRAVELNAGAGKLVDARPNIKYCTLALEEIRQGKVKLKREAEEKKKKKKK